ncbi:hypothetical protein [Sorangium sp. So ce887]|uniref:hypothetical protein n=1 Tax=Sorangium sp. So ce887 TaxID=3133324 RepID=UPI003F6295C0
MVMVGQVVLRVFPSETPRSATACTFPVEGVSISFLVVAIAVVTMLALNALPSCATGRIRAILCRLELARRHASKWPLRSAHAVC